MTGKARRRRRIAVVTGTRAEYGLLRSTMEAIHRRRDLKLQTVVTGMHLLKKFGRTIDEIVRDGRSIDARIKMQAGDDSPLDQSAGLSRGVAGIARFLQDAETDVVVVLGDRIEAMAGALAAVTTGKLLAHIHGGDIAPGDLDESLRHAITKLAHVHLAATRRARQRIIRMGEAPARAHWVGAPGLDRLRELIDEHHRLPTPTGRAIVVHHARGRSAAHEKRTMTSVLRAVEAAGLATIIIYPNTDRGHTGILEAIDAYRRRAAPGQVQVVRSLDRDDYLRLLIDADVMVGNSSSGVIEAPTAGTPSVNVGPRQRGRERGGGSVLDTEENFASVRDALRRALLKRPRRGGPSVYGTGRVGPKIAATVAQIPLDAAFRHKLNTY